jgi:hypothetical protein
MEHELLELERELAAGDGDTYRARLAPDALVIVPGQRLDRDACAAAIDASPGWDDFSLSEASARELGSDAALVSYRFDGRRGDDFAYAALMTSVYARRDGDWKLLLHQQTPLG